MSSISVEVKLRQTVEVDVKIDDVIESINDCYMIDRWEYIAQILNGVVVDLGQLTKDQEASIKKFLIGKLSLFDEE